MVKFVAPDAFDAGDRWRKSASENSLQWRSVGAPRLRPAGGRWTIEHDPAATDGLTRY